MRLVSLPTVVRALAIFLASLQTARSGAVQAQTYGESQLQTTTMAPLPVRLAPLVRYATPLSPYATLRPERLGAPALPAELGWMGAGMVGATTAARSPGPSRGLEPEATPAYLSAEAQQRAVWLRFLAGASDPTTRFYRSAHQPRAPCSSPV